MTAYHRIVGLAACALALDGCARSFVTTASEQTYLRAEHNWAFRERFPRADRLLNAFDYGHAILYETLISAHDAPAAIDGPVFTRVTQQVLRHPPPVPLEEAAIGPDYVTLIPEVVATFEWAHMLHRQLYDVWAEQGLTRYQRDVEVHKLIAYYRSRPDLALSTEPRSMELMEGQPYSLAFRRQDPKYNGLLWSYHWFQMALYDALMADRNDAKLHAAVDSVVGHFFAMVENAPANMPADMPMSGDAAPRFAEAYPDAANIFDNLHSLHDVVSDILASPVVPRAQKRAAILRAAAAYRNSLSTDERTKTGHR
ncbi:MAG: hypothetical protein JWM41_801 [Gemmatimonadetes bacterium]|nr:hypothetical protein [Gemmatimonadota bacterium]